MVVAMWCAALHGAGIQMPKHANIAECHAVFAGFGGAVGFVWMADTSCRGEGCTGGVISKNSQRQSFW